MVATGCCRSDEPRSLHIGGLCQLRHRLDPQLLALGRTSRCWKNQTNTEKSGKTLQRQRSARVASTTRMVVTRRTDRTCCCWQLYWLGCSSGVEAKAPNPTGSTGANNSGTRTAHKQSARWSNHRLHGRRFRRTLLGRQVMGVQVHSVQLPSGLVVDDWLWFDEGDAVHRSAGTTVHELCMLRRSMCWCIQATTINSSSSARSSASTYWRLIACLVRRNMDSSAARWRQWAATSRRTSCRWWLQSAKCWKSWVLPAQTGCHCAHRAQWDDSDQHCALFHCHRALCYTTTLQLRNVGVRFVRTDGAGAVG